MKTGHEFLVDQAHDPQDIAADWAASDPQPLQALKEFFLLRLKLFSAALVDKTQQAQPQVLVHLLLTQPGAAVGASGRPRRPTGQAKVLDSRAELDRLKMMAEAEEVRIRRVASANSEKMRLEAEVLKTNPMLIQKIIAERLSDKVQIMMIPADVKNFFATDVLRSAMSPMVEK